MNTFKLEAAGVGGVWKATLITPDGTRIAFEASNLKNAQKTARGLAADWEANNRPHRVEAYSDSFTL